MTGRENGRAATGGTSKSAHTYARSTSPRSRTARVVGEIGRRIVSGRFPENGLLPGDAALETEFRVSRTVLREAIKTLAGKGLVQSKARIGTRVRDRADWNLFDHDVLIWHAESGFDDAFLRALGEMRLALEPEAAALAAARRTDEQLRQLSAQVDAMGAPGVSRRDFVLADLAFHLVVAVMAANPFLRSISTLIEVALVASLTRSSPLDDPKDVRKVVAEHRAIADAIGRRDASAARSTMRIVILEGIRRAAVPEQGQSPRSPGS